LIVLTGGPGSGKSSLIERLRGEGYPTSPEAGRAIIRDQVAIGGHALPWSDPMAYAELMLSWDMRAHRLARASPKVVFFDRGVPDVIGYLRLLGLAVPVHMERAAEVFRYHRRVLIAPPWPEIHRKDEERRQDPDEAERTYAVMQETYTGLGYDLVELPRAPVEERLRFVVETLDLAL
jgi:predicted ATPase